MDSFSKIAFLGTGLMGSRQAARLLDAGFAVTAWNRTASRAEALAARGATLAGSATEAVGAADCVITMMTDGRAVAEVLFSPDVEAALARGALVIDMSSIAPAQARAHAARLERIGVRHLDAPVSGGTVGAEQGTLAIMVGGGEEDFSRAGPVFAAMGRATLVGPSGAGQLAKLANQMIVGGNIAVLAEALVFAARGGADPRKVREALRGGFAESRVLDLHGQRMVDHDFVPRGRAAIHLKDYDNILAAAAETGFSAPLSEVVATLFRDLLKEEGDLDHSALSLVYERRNRRAVPRNREKGD